jgi:hypothetical protein
MRVYIFLLPYLLLGFLIDDTTPICPPPFPLTILWLVRDRKLGAEWAYYPPPLGIKIKRVLI